MTIHYYEDADFEKWCPNIVITKILGMRTFWDMQQNQEIHKDIAFFHHLMIEKRKETQYDKSVFHALRTAGT